MIARAGRQHRAGFSLIETVLVIAIISIVVAMTIPSLSLVRNKGREISSQSRIRSHAAVMLMYTHDQRDAWPSYTYASATSSVIRYNGGTQFVTAGYFEMWRYWMVALVDSHYDGKWNDLSLRSPFDRPTPFVYTGYGYVYPCVFIAAPEYWDRTTRMLPPTQLRGTKVSDVLYPDLKALLVDDSSRYVAWNENSKQGVVTAQVDGRATATRLSGILPGYQDADGFNLPPYLEAHAGGGISDLLHTQQGVRGRDIAR